jgi:putative transposase
MLVVAWECPPAFRRQERQSMSDCSIIQRGYEYRIYPTAEQEARFEHHFGCGRWVWNYSLEQRQQHYRQTGMGLSYNQMNS